MDQQYGFSVADIGNGSAISLFVVSVLTIFVVPITAAGSRDLLLPLVVGSMGPPKAAKEAKVATESKPVVMTTSSSQTPALTTSTTLSPVVNTPAPTPTATSVRRKGQAAQVAPAQTRWPENPNEIIQGSVRPDYSDGRGCNNGWYRVHEQIWCYPE